MNTPYNSSRGISVRVQRSQKTLSLYFNNMAKYKQLYVRVLKAPTPNDLSFKLALVGKEFRQQYDMALRDNGRQMFTTGALGAVTSWVVHGEAIVELDAPVVHKDHILLTGHIPSAAMEAVPVERVRKLKEDVAAAAAAFTEVRRKPKHLRPNVFIEVEGRTFSYNVPLLERMAFMGKLIEAGHPQITEE